MNVLLFSEQLLFAFPWDFLGSRRVWDIGGGKFVSTLARLAANIGSALNVFGRKAAMARSGDLG